jgi:Cu/Ag efflux protein CusF
MLVLSLLSATSALAQASRFSAEIAKMEIAERRVTLKASMGHQTLRVAPGVMLDAFKPGDKVHVTFGQDGTEPIITSLEVIKS